MKKILVIDDEPDIVELVSYNLIKSGYQVDHALDGEAALKKLTHNDYDLIVLDLMLPSIDGLQLCSIVRNNPRLSHMPIIMLTARSDEFDKVHGLEMGADDYITKPFSPKELIARIKAIIRRTETRKFPLTNAGEEKCSISVLKIKDIIIDKEKYIVTLGNLTIKLSATEFKLLLYLAERPRKVFSREQLLDAVWGDDIYIEPRTVDVHIRRIRSKVEKNPDDPQYLKTMRGIGYFFNA